MKTYTPEEKRERKALDFSIKRIKECMEPPGAPIDDPATTLAALHFFERPSASHQCYWNDRFCVAVACGLVWEKQQLSAWCAVSNGIWNYWEVVTHSGFYTDLVLEKLGIPTSHIWKKRLFYEEKNMYYQISPEIAKMLIEKFNLPTTSMGVKETLTEEEQQWRNIFNKRYPYDSIL